MVLIIVVATFVSAKDLARPKQSSSAAKASKASAVRYRLTSRGAFPVASSVHGAVNEERRPKARQPL